MWNRNNTRNILCCSFTGILLGIGISLNPLASLAADTDLFLNPGLNNSTRPNVLVILDNTANWSASTSKGNNASSKYDVEKVALTDFFSSLKPGMGGSAKFNVGLMLYAETGNPNNNVGGGYPRYHIRAMDGVNAGALSNLISNLDRNADKGNNANFAQAMHEAFLYFKGLKSRCGHEKAKTDSGKPQTITNPANYAPGDVGVWKSGTPGVMKPASSLYTDPTAGSPCGNNYIIFITNGPPDNGENTESETLLKTLGGWLSTDPIKLMPSGKQSTWSDEYARFLSQNNIRTFTIDVLPEKTGQGPDNTALLKSMANQGDGVYYAVTDTGSADYAEQIKKIMNRIFDQIQSVNSVFAASALPISLNVRGTNENQVYLGMFRPEPSRKPVWLGNLKLYQLGLIDGQPYLVDTNAKAVQDPITGFVRSDAISYWTHSSSYWALDPQGEGGASDSPDGQFVEKGAAAQKQRDAVMTSTGNQRKLYTKTADCTAAELSSCPFNSTHVSATALGAADNAERDAIIEWIKGIDNRNPAERTFGEARPSIHGDIIHATPAIVNYGNGKIVVFYGSNDGLYRAVQGGLNTTADAGKELWAFVAPEFLGKLKRQRDNTPLIKAPDNNPSSTEALDANRDYFFDGGTAVYRSDDGSRVWLFLIPRRGGRFIYALDVTTPENPKLLWKKTFTDTGYEKLGFAWSLPQIRTLNLKTTVSTTTYIPTPVLFFGGGYDPDYDDALPRTGSPTMGTALFAVKAETGDILWSKVGSPLQFPIPSDVSFYDKNRDLYPDYLYVGDTGANIWRVNLVNTGGNTDPGDWTISKLAALGGTGAEGRKFLFRPSLTKLEQCGSALAGNLGVYIGSGDREHPLAVSRYNDIFDPTNVKADAPVINDSFYMVVDDGSVTNVTQSNLVDATNTATTINLVPEKNASNAPTNNGWGWYFGYSTSEEKTVGNAVVFYNQAIFGTSSPPATTIDPKTCTGNLGTARIYQVQHCSAQPIEGAGGRSTTVPGGGLLPPPVPFSITSIVGGDGSSTGGGDTDDGGTPIQGVILGLNVVGIKNPGEPIENQLIYWYKEMGQ